jgi:hypothetical protein
MQHRLPGKRRLEQQCPDNETNSQGYVAVEKNGQWGKATEPPGLAALNGG